MLKVASKVRRRIFEPLFIIKNRSPKIDYWRQIEHTQYLPFSDLKKIQQERFQIMWKFLWKNNEFYTKRFIDHGINQKSIQTTDDIVKLPILTKKEIRSNTNLMISKGFNKAELLHFKTGGSTGRRLDIHITEECSELRNACARRHDRWSGWEPGETIGAVWGNPHYPKTIKNRLIDALVQPYIYLDTMAVNEEAVREFADAWEKRHGVLLFGHAHSLFILSKYCDQLNIAKIQPKGIISTSMMLLPHERHYIEQVFKCPVTDRYGCEEVSLIGSQCEQHSGLHMNIEHLIIEFIKEDGSIAEPGEPGRIIVTDLLNTAMPFIRYSVEDVGFSIDKACSCGRGLPIMGNVTGRLADFMIKNDGTKVSGVSIIENTLTKIPGIDQMQLVQESIDDLIINIVPGIAYNKHSEQQVLRYFQSLFPGSRVTMNTIAEILPEPSGKYRFSICKLHQ